MSGQERRRRKDLEHIEILEATGYGGGHAAAAAAKSLQSCPTLCDPVDGSPLGSSVSEILQARILDWVATSFSKHIPILALNMCGGGRFVCMCRKDIKHSFFLRSHI